MVLDERSVLDQRLVDLALLFLAARIEQMAFRAVEVGMGCAQTVQRLACARMVLKRELGLRQTEHERVIRSMDAGQAAFEQPFGVGGTATAQTLLRERRLVLDRVGFRGPPRELAQVTLRVDDRADVAHRLAGGAAAGELGQNLQEEVGQAAGEGQRQDDEQPLARPAGPNDVGRAEQLQTEHQGGEGRHDGAAFRIGAGSLSHGPLASVKSGVTP